jgi:hypothetical protein
MPYGSGSGAAGSPPTQHGVHNWLGQAHPGLQRTYRQASFGAEDHLFTIMLKQPA